MLKVSFITILVAVAGVLIYAATRPNSFHIERTVHINAAPDEIYPYMSDFRKGTLWIPYEKKDPNMKRRFSGADSGQGSIYEFEGNREVGVGRLEIVETESPTKVVLAFDMIKPMQAHNTIEYRIEPNSGGADVTWSMQGTCNYTSKIVGIFINVDKMVGNDFETGLASLKALVEKT